MKVESWQAWNPDAIIKSKLGNRLQASYRKIDAIIGYVREINADIVDGFIKAFQKRISFVNDIDGIFELASIIELLQDYEELKSNHDLARLATKYIFYHLKIPMKLGDFEREIEVTSFNHACENERIMYYLARAGSDVVGEKEGIEFWKKVVTLRLRDENARYEERIRELVKSGKKPSTMIERSDSAIKYWTEIGLGDFTRLVIDENKIHYRFDKCVTHEVLKDLNDPEYAYIISCYIGDAPTFNFPNRPQFLRRTQTLHHGKFCDELYWDPKVLDEPEQPTLEFTRNM
jgi:hypothetical protein